MLAVKDLNASVSTVAGTLGPCQSNVKLWTFLKELFHQTTEAPADSARINPVVVEKVCNRQLCKEIPQPAEFVLVERDRQYLVFADLGE